ncbi:hybrid sensor histidine kinase/response regulator [Thiocystis violascens]|uniref:hybrid sensor histidine kinase/response regulator n=1 Tax=Thiocystis violascens TaxID=73141 RepID=UPI000693D514|nr:hybrid sensor histidine kinase/response regulator [Thiocystis violascens]
METAWLALLPLGLLTLLLGVAVTRLTLRLLTPLAILVRGLDTPVEMALPPPPATSPAEVHQLWAALVAMRARLAEHHRQMGAHARELEARVAARTAELCLARDAAEQANRAKTLFLANVSHELRTPLQAIILHARLLERPTPATGSEPLAVIRHASHQLLGLIEQLLTLAKVEAGHPLEVTYQRVALGTWLEEVAATLRPTLAPRNQLALHLPATEITVVSDRNRLTQALYNLIRNADKFTAGGVIRLTLSTDDTDESIRIEVEVEDSGIGIPPTDLEHIFAPFYQGSSGMAGSVSSGIGLGLWLSRCFMAALDGTLTVTSTPSVGSRFRLTLPRAPSRSGMLASADPPSMPSQPPKPGLVTGQRLLLAEDEDSIRTPLVILLSEAGFVVDACADWAGSSRCW